MRIQFRRYDEDSEDRSIAKATISSPLTTHQNARSRGTRTLRQDISPGKQRHIWQWGMRHKDIGAGKHEPFSVSLVGDGNLDLDAGLEADARLKRQGQNNGSDKDVANTHDLLDDLARRVEVDEALVHLELVAVPGLRTLTARLQTASLNTCLLCRLSTMDNSPTCGW